MWLQPQECEPKRPALYSCGNSNTTTFDVGEIYRADDDGVRLCQAVHRVESGYSNHRHEYQLYPEHGIVVEVAVSGSKNPRTGPTPSELGDRLKREGAAPFVRVHHVHDMDSWRLFSLMTTVHRECLVGGVLYRAVERLLDTASSHRRSHRTPQPLRRMTIWEARRRGLVSDESGHIPIPVKGGWMRWISDSYRQLGITCGNTWWVDPVSQRQGHVAPQSITDLRVYHHRVRWQGNVAVWWLDPPDQFGNATLVCMTRSPRPARVTVDALRVEAPRIEFAFRGYAWVRHCRPRDID